VNREDVEEGKELYTREDLVHLGGHLDTAGKEVHGNGREGCDSLVIGNLERDIRETDGLLWFLYTTDRPNGAPALCQSYHKKRPLRVFRSSLLGGKYAPPFLDTDNEDEEKDDSDVAYRYDGLYMVRAVWDVGGRETESFPVVGVEGWQTYFLTRLPKKPLEKEKMEEGLEYNLMGLQELWSSIQKMRGVRKPKKFEIPTPPVKLGALKREKVSGVYKERKCVGWVRPVAVVAVAKPAAAPRAKSPKTSESEKKQQKKQQEKEQEEEVESDSSSGEEEEEISKHPPPAQDEEDEDDSESDTLHHQQQLQQHTPLSATPPKALTPRPRLNSVVVSQPHSKKPSPPPTTATHKDDDDSSDSETSTSQIIAATPIATAAVRQAKRKKPSPIANNKIQKPSPSPTNSKIQPVSNSNLNVCAFFPKRASAARAETANREMFGKKSYKRKSSETTTTAAASVKATAATTVKATAKATAKQPSPRGTANTVSTSARKRIKVTHYGDSSDSSDSSSPEDDLVDQSILTIHSRVLVVYKGSLFKATIRKRRFKNGSHDFLIHYDGNKKTNVHWVKLDRISEILEIFVEDAPKRKRGVQDNQAASADGKQQAASADGKQVPQATAKKKKGGGNTNGSGKKKAPAKQESHDASIDEEDDERKMPPAKEEAPCSSDGDNGKSSSTKAIIVAPSAEEAPPSSDDTDGKMPEKKIHPTSHGNVVEKEPTIIAAAGSHDVPASTNESSHNPSITTIANKKEEPNTKDAAPQEEATHYDEENDEKKSSSSSKSSQVSANKNVDQEKNDEKQPILISDTFKADSHEDANDGTATTDRNTSASENIREALPSKTQEPKSDNNDSEDDIEMGEFLADAGLNDCFSPTNSEVSKEEEDEEDDTAPTKSLPFSNNDETTTATATADATKQCNTVLSDACVAKVSNQPLEMKETTTTATTVASTSNTTTLGEQSLAITTTPTTSSNLKDPLQILAEEAESDIADSNDLPGSSDKDTTDENNSTSSSGGNAVAKQQQEQASTSGEPTGEFKYPIGGSCYVEYRQIFYSSTILKTRRKRGATEYLVHYEGYKKSSNRWVKVNALHQVNVTTTQRFEEQRFIPPDILYESAPSPVFSMTTRGKKASEMGCGEPPSSSFNNSMHPSAATTMQNQKPPHERNRSDTSETSHQSAFLNTIDSGVVFLPGSMVFVEWSDALYLAKMVKKRYSGERMEYLISYDGFQSDYDAWVSIHKIYEVNPQTKRVFKRINSDILSGGTAVSDHPTKQQQPPGPKQQQQPPGTKRRETRKKTHDDLIAASAAPNNYGNTAPTTATTMQHPSSESPFPSTRGCGASLSSSCIVQPTIQQQPTIPTITTSTVDMQGTEPGVEFLPGSTLFAEYKGSLCLAKMLKKRGKGDYMEYLLQYNMKKKKKKKQKQNTTGEEEEEARCWVSVALVYEINPQTKRMFRQLSKKEIEKK